MDPFPAAKRIRPICIGFICCLPCSSVFVILQFLGNFLCDFLDEVSSSSVILHASLFFLCELDPPIDCLVVNDVDEIQARIATCAAQSLNFFSPIL